MSKKTLFHYAAPAIITGMLFAAAAVSWEEPGSNPPDGNVPAPINVSADNQYKEGWLTVGNTSTPSMQLDVQGIAPVLGSLNVTGGAVLNTGGATFGLIVDNGSVGIGTDNPQAQLHLEGDSGTCAEINLTHKGVGGSAGITFDVVNDLDSFAIKAYENKLAFFTLDPPNPSTQRMSILPNGKIGIGIENPDELLHVNGNIKASGKIYTDSACGISGAVFTAEEGAELDDSSYEWSFGNGATEDDNGTRQACPGTITAMSVQCDSCAGAGSTVEIRVSNNETNCQCDLSAGGDGTGAGCIATGCADAFNAGDFLNVYTIDDTGACQYCTTTWWVSYN